MALTATIFRVDLDLSDVDGNVYRQESLRLALHPSEEPARLVARLLAYCLCWREGLQFTRDLAEADQPALAAHDDTGQLAVWVEVGTPSAKRLHKASKAGAAVTVITFRGADDGLESLRREVAGQSVFRSEAIEVIALPAVVVSAIAAQHRRSSAWTVIIVGGALQVLVDGHSFEFEPRRVPLFV